MWEPKWKLEWKPTSSSCMNVNQSWNQFDYFIKYFSDNRISFIIKLVFGSQSPCVRLGFPKQQLLATKVEALFRVKFRGSVI
jgi:hypothetical protein